MATKKFSRKKIVRRAKKRIRQSRKPKLSLKVLVTRGSITQVETPVVAVGNYKGIAPTETSALGAIDQQLDQWITRAIDQGFVGSDLGQLFFIPVSANRIAAKSVMLAGMGNYGVFDYSDLRYLAMNMCYAVSALKAGKFATVLIGSGEGNLDLETAVKGLLSGVCDALHHVDRQERIKELEVVEFSESRFNEIKDILKQLEKDDNAFEHLTISIAERKLRQPPKKAKRKTKTRSTASEPQDVARFVNRITIEHNGEGYAFSALTQNAVVPVRQMAVQKFFTDGITKQLKLSDTEERQEKFGALLHNYLFPPDFEQMISNNQPLTLVVDSTTAGLPWEMACFGPKRNLTYFGVGLKLTRQFRTMLAGAPGIAPPLNNRLKVLIIADPAPASEGLSLDKAKHEGEKVLEVFKKFGEEHQNDPNYGITIESRIGSDQCDPVELLELILNGGFDIIHYAGHGVFDEKQPNNSGWVFGKDAILSAREIFSARQVPRLIFANACFSAVVNNGEVPSPRASNRKLAGLAEAFFERGVQNYIGTGWEVGDSEAQMFAEVFYNSALRGDFLGDSLAAARLKIFKWGSTWGAYQHYGQSNARVIVN